MFSIVSPPRSIELQFIINILSITLLFHCVYVCAGGAKKKTASRIAIVSALTFPVCNLISLLWPYIISSTLSSSSFDNKKKKLNSDANIESKEGEQKVMGRVALRHLVTLSALPIVSMFPVQSDRWWFEFFFRVCDLPLSLSLCAPDHFRLTFIYNSSSRFHRRCRLSSTFCYDSVRSSS